MTGTKFSSASRSLIRITVGLFLVAPYLIWLSKISNWSWPEFSEWSSIFATAMFQAGLSAMLSLLFGFLLFVAVQGWRSARIRALAEGFLLLPNMVPPLFVVLSLMSWVTPWMAFPRGMGAVVLAHALLNSGLVAVALDRLVLNKMAGLADAAWLMGSTRLRFWREIGWSYLKGDFACLFVFVFGLAFTSFSIPLLLGGDRTLTLEVAIFDLIRLEGRWDKAVILAALQGLGLFGLAWLLPYPFWPTRSTPRRSPLLGWPGVRHLVWLPALVVMGGWLAGLAPSVAERWPSELPLMEAFVTSAALGLAVGLLHLILFLGVVYASPHRQLTRFLNGYLAPSTVITGFAFLLLPGEGDEIKLTKLMLSITLLSFPLLYRWMVHSSLAALRPQIAAGRLLGAGWGLILFEVVWPQVAPQLLRASGLAAFWAVGDFAITGIVAGDLNTVPLLMEGLLDNYRIESAQLLMFPMLLVGILLYGLFVGVGRYVVD